MDLKTRNDLQDEMEWEVFEFEPDDTICNLQEWLECTKPSVIKLEDGIGWISAIDTLARRRAQAVKEWAEASNHTVQTIFRIAEKYDFKSGKWMIFEDLDSIDAIWHKLLNSFEKKCLEIMYVSLKFLLTL